MEWIAQPQAWVALATLTALEIVLGIDNIVFISVLVGRLPAAQRNKARTIGLALAMGTRILLLLTLTWIMTLTTPILTVFRNEISGRDIILIAGGLFLLAKSTHEIHHSLEGKPESAKAKMTRNFISILVQIAVLDIVFSLDSVITAVGLADHIQVMILAIVIAVLVMMLSARFIGNFVDTHPTIKMLALSFLILVGFSLMGEGLDLHIPKGYIYFAMAFSLGVEILNLKVRERTTRPIRLRKTIPD
jgi:predicted tellurium resistance membrane protein TerC